MFIEATSPCRYPDWSQSDRPGVVPRSAGYDAARRFDPGSSVVRDLADPAGGTVSHNDLEPSNVVFRDGVAVALLDFEFGPGRRL